MAATAIAILLLGVVWQFAGGFWNGSAASSARAA